MLPDPWFLFPVDALGAMRSTGNSRPLDEAEIETVLRRTRAGYHRVVAALASVGNDVIMDYPLSEPWRLSDLLDVLAGCEVTLVDVRCSAEELDRRERARGDRPLGLARSQSVFDHDDRDVVVDSTDTAAATCAATIAAHLSGRRGDTEAAFGRLARLRTSDGWGLL